MCLCQCALAWTSVTNFSNVASRAHNPHIVADLDGNLYCVWFGNNSDSNYWQVCFQYWTAASGWTAPLVISGSDTKCNIADIAIDASNRLYVVYWSNDRTHYVERDALGNWSAPLDITSQAQKSTVPTIEVSPDGSKVYTAWAMQNQTGGSYDIMFRSRINGVWGSLVNLSNDSDLSSEADMSLDKWGNLHAVWQNGDVRLYYRKMNADGTWNAKTTIDDTTSHRSNGPSIACWGDKLHVSWLEDTTGGGGGNWEIVYRHFDGTSWGTITQLSNNPSTTDAGPCVAVDWQGQAHVAWSDSSVICYRYQSSGAWQPTTATPITVAQSKEPWLTITYGKRKQLVCMSNAGSWQCYHCSEDIPNTAPTIATAYLNTTSLVANDTTQYTATLIANEPDGPNELVDMRVMFNIDTVGHTGRGYLSWGNTTADITRYGGNWTIQQATSGYWGFMSDDWGYQYITPISCTTSLAGNQRTVAWTFRVKPAWGTTGPATGNFIGMWARDPVTTTGWLSSNTVFGYNFNVSQTSGTISGTVKDLAGNNISGATVSTTTGGYSTTSNSGGAYTLASVTPGTYSVVASKATYSAQTKTGIVVTSSNTTACAFNLTPQIGAVTGFVVYGADAKSYLYWTNPTHSSFTGTMVRYSTAGYPADATDGTLVCDRAAASGSSDSFTHTLLTNGASYYYSAFAHDAAGTYAAVSNLLAVPQITSCWSVKLLTVPFDLTDVVVTAIFASDGCIYVEEPDRTSGLRVVTATSGLSLGDIVHVKGAIATRTMNTVAAEKQVVASALTKASSGTQLLPLAMGCSSLGGSPVLPDVPGVKDGVGLNNLGLLVKIAGRVSTVDGNLVYVNDGSCADDVVILCPSAPSVSGGNFVRATGVVEGYVPVGWSVGRRCIRLVAASDIQVIPEP